MFISCINSSGHTISTVPLMPTQGTHMVTSALNHDRWAEQEAAQSTRLQHPVPLHQGNPMTSYKAAMSLGKTWQPLWKHLQGRNLCNLPVTEQTLKLTDFVAHHQLVMNLREPRHNAVKCWKEDICIPESNVISSMFLWMPGKENWKSTDFKLSPSTTYTFVNGKSMLFAITSICCLSSPSGSGMNLSNKGAM